MVSEVSEVSKVTDVTGATSSTAETVETEAGTARVTWHRADRPRLVLALGHGAGGGIEARDLVALADVLPRHGVTVARVEQPWRVAGKKVTPAPRTLDAGWRGIWPALAAPGLPVVSGGRSAGARVACRTAAELGAAAVLALGFPLHPPGKPEKSRGGSCSARGCPPWSSRGKRPVREAGGVPGRTVRAGRGGLCRSWLRRAETGGDRPPGSCRDHHGRGGEVDRDPGVTFRECGGRGRC
ncbi:hypothetical protein GCM10020295_27000 [Streptomyces cinereospinus]